MAPDAQAPAADPLWFGASSADIRDVLEFDLVRRRRVIGFDRHPEPEVAVEPGADR